VVGVKHIGNAAVRDAVAVKLVLLDVCNHTGSFSLFFLSIAAIANDP